MTDRRANTLLAVALGLLIALGAHESGKPWWADWPPLADATDIGLLSGLGIRWFLSLFERGRVA